MESPNDLNLNEPGAPAASKLGLIGVILGVLGFLIYCAPLAVAFFLGASGNPPSAQSPTAIGLGLLSYCGSFLCVIGGVLGGVGIARGENKTYGIIAIVLGVVSLCTCVTLAFTGLALG